MSLELVRDVVTILASFGTLLVAIIALYNLKGLQRQLNLTEKQFVLNRSAIYPFLELLDKESKDNKVSLTLKNVGKGPATRIGLKVSFTPLNVVDSKWNFVEKLFEINGKLKKRISPTTSFVPLKSKSGKVILLPNRTEKFSGDVKFIYRYESKDGWHYSTFDELRELLKTNGLRFAAVNLALVYFDISESANETEGLAFNVVDFEKHKSIADAISDKKPLPLPPHTIDLADMPCLAWETCKNLKSHRTLAEQDNF